MNRGRLVIVIIAWLLASIGGAWTLLTLFEAYMTTTSYLKRDAFRSALPLPVISILLALAAHFWPTHTQSKPVWPWCIPVYIVAGGPLLMLLLTWWDQN